MSFQDHLDLSLYTAIKVPFYHITVSDQLKKFTVSMRQKQTNWPERRSISHGPFLLDEKYPSIIHLGSWHEK